MAVLQVAREPAQVAAEEFGQGRRVCLARSIFFGKHANAPAGTGQHGGLDLVVRQDVVAVRQRGQAAMRAEWGDADQGVMAPIRSLVALPPVLANGPGPHAGPHAELEQAREGG